MAAMPGLDDLDYLDDLVAVIAKSSRGSSTVARNAARGPPHGSGPVPR